MPNAQGTLGSSKYEQNSTAQGDRVIDYINKTLMRKVLRL